MSQPSPGGSPGPRRRPLRTILLFLVGIVLLLVGCVAGYILSGVFPIPPHGSFRETCLADKPELRYWTRDVFGVALQLPISATAPDGAISDAVKARLAQVPDAQFSADQLEAVQPFIRAGRSAVAFYRLVGNNSSSGCDSRLIGAVNAIDRALTPQPDDAQATTVLHPLTVQVGADAVAIVGASPDWTFGASGISDGGGGNPGGPPRLLPASLGAKDAQDIAVPTGTLTHAFPDGTGTTVVVLDTAYAANSAPLGLQPCARAANLLCIPKSATLPDAFASLSSVFEESYVSLTADNPAAVTSGGAQGINPGGPPYEFLDANGAPVNIVDHGLFVSGLIHLAAPGAQIRLVRVLNDYGIGSLQGILAGLQTLAAHPEKLDIPQGSPVVVNLSLGFGPPADCLTGVWDHWQQIQQAEDDTDQGKGSDPAKWPQSTLSCADGSTAKTHLPFRSGASALALGGGGAYAALSLPLSLLISDLANPHGLGGIRNIRAIVAAAGNESSGLRQPLNADLPAAICDVIPVAATDAAGARAAFSNSPYLGSGSCLAVTPTVDGAGHTTSVTIRLAPRTGAALDAVGKNICAIFLQRVPSALIPPSTTPTPSAPTSTAPTHMALWDGTSFAAGFASGYIARQGLSVILDTETFPFQVPDRQACNRL